MMKRTRKMIMANNRNDMAAMLNQQSSRGSWRPSKLQRDNRNTNKMHKLKKLMRMKMTVMRRKQHKIVVAKGSMKVVRNLDQERASKVKKRWRCEGSQKNSKMLNIDNNNRTTQTKKNTTTKMKSHNSNNSSSNIESRTLKLSCKATKNKCKLK